METAVMLPSPANEFNFDNSSTCTTPYMSAPSSPPRLGTFTPFFSAPTSPTRISFSPHSSSSSASASLYASLSSVPFTWEDKPGTPKSSPNDETRENGEFAFDFSGQLNKHLYLPADELFQGGKIKPLKPPPCLNYESSPRSSSPRSPKKTFKEAFSPRSSRTRDFDPFAEAFKNTSMEESRRGRERKYTNITDSFSSNNYPSSSRHNKTRSLSPFRVSDLLFDQETEQDQKSDNNKTSNSPSSSSSWYKKWKLKDLLLFRSASEGRQTSKAQLKKYTVLKKSGISHNNININEEDDDMKNTSFRSTESSSVACSRRRRGGTISAHELHYTINRAVSEEMKRKTFLPYKQGLLGCLGFQPAAGTADISRGGGSMTRG